MKTLLRTAAVLPLFFAAPAFAQDQATAAAPVPDASSTPDTDGDSIQIGAGVGYMPSYEGSDDYVPSVVPGIRGRVSGINFTLRGNRFSADLIPTKGGPGWDLQLGPVAQLNFNRHSNIRDAQVKKLGKLPIVVEVGGFAGIGKQGVLTSDYDKLNLTVSYVHDLGSVHGSYVITPGIDYGTPLSRKAFLGVNLSADYMGNGYSQTYFGVTPAGALASGLPAFNGRKGWKDWTVGTYGLIALTGDLTHGLGILASGSYRRLTDDAALSPVTRIAGSRDQWVGILGIGYTF